MRYNLDTIIQRCNEKHNFFYLYHNITEYKHINEKVPIECKLHGIFYQSWHGHAQGSGCPSCGVDRLKKYFTCTTEAFIKKAIDAHGDKYDYSKVDYLLSGKNIKIICKIHGEFEQLPNNHLRGQGCPNCGRLKRDTDQCKTLTQFIKHAREIHENKYEYFFYKKGNIKVKIFCNKCEFFFEQTPENHVAGQGCPKCRLSKGELMVEKILKESNIPFIRQYAFKDCVYKKNFFSIFIFRSIISA